MKNAIFTLIIFTISHTALAQATQPYVVCNNYILMIN